MKQFQFDYHSITTLKRDLDKISLWCKSRVFSHVVFQIYSNSMDKGQIDLVCDVISQNFPDSIYMGCSTGGNIIDGRISNAEISVVCTIFEYPTTQLKLLQYTMDADNAVDVVGSIKEEIKANPWVKAVELQLTTLAVSMTPFCDAFKDVDPSIAIFGGGAINPNLTSTETCIFSNVGGYSGKGVLVLLMGGEDFFVHTTHVIGWKPLGREFVVTKARGPVLYELNGEPAYEIYHRYLNIQNDEHFIYNTLEFPLFYKRNGIDIMRAPVACNEDGSVVMSSDIEEGVKVRLAYGDPWTILESVRKDGHNIGVFSPEIIKAFSCVVRRIFWGKEEISSETLPLQSIASTSGFYSSSEFLRTGCCVNQHNATLVIAGMREGKGGERYDFEMPEEAFSGKVSMINRLATFIDVTAQEQAETYAKLQLTSITDSLAEVFNRGEIQRRITQCVTSGRPGCLVMFDIDNFKQINDTWGHKEGDNVIQEFSRLLRRVADETGVSGVDAAGFNMTDFEGMCAKEYELHGGDSLQPVPVILNVKSPIGRWGGEEFMVLLQEASMDAAVDFAEKVRKAFNEMVFEKAGHRSVSIGVTEIKDGESADEACVRVDQALYRAKDGGKNRVVVI